MKDLLTTAIQLELCNKNKNVKYVQTCKNKSRKKLKKVAFLSSGLSRFDAKKNDTLGPGRKNNSYSIILNKNIF